MATDPDPASEGFPIVTQTRENAGLNTVMSNSFGFGGTNAHVVIEAMEREETRAVESDRP